MGDGKRPSRTFHTHVSCRALRRLPLGGPRDRSAVPSPRKARKIPELRCDANVLTANHEATNETASPAGFRRLAPENNNGEGLALRCGFRAVPRAAPRVMSDVSLPRSGEPLDGLKVSLSDDTPESGHNAERGRESPRSSTAISVFLCL
ncbi:unnamed protein product [Lampetra fluviatilis]